MITATSFQLLADLEANNNRDWFHANRAAIADQVQQPFAQLLEEISAAVADAPVPLQGSAATMFRMNRDVRFSADKSPYKPSVSGLLTPTGTKAEAGGLMFLQMDKSGGFVACGFYKMPTPELNSLRDAIVAQPDAFRAALDGLADAGFDLSAEMMLKTMPRGYSDHADAWFADYLRRQIFIARLELNQAQIISGGVVKEAARLVRASAKLLLFGQTNAQ